jgi:hypothetical protein
MAARMGEGAEEALSRITDQMSGLMETLRTVAEQTRSAGAEAARTLAARIEGAATGFETAAERMTQLLAAAAQNTGDSLTRSASDAAQGLQTAAAGIRQTLNDSGQALARQADLFGLRRRQARPHRVDQDRRPRICRG